MINGERRKRRPTRTEVPKTKLALEEKYKEEDKSLGRNRKD